MSDDKTPPRATTARGFAIYDEFTDMYGGQVRVQQSSLASEPAVWIFGKNSDLGSAAHLTVEQARRVRDALGAFLAEHGS